ncbi:MAG: AI-2E family transporter [Phycisphaerales bacterium]|nr:AI-2E family transporter [Phycisphaerales bacterium]
MKPQKQVPDIPSVADRHLWQIQPIRDAAWIFVLVFVMWLGYAMRSVTVPLLVALLLAYLFEPLISMMQHRLKFPRPLAVGSVLGVGGIALLLVIGLTVPLVVGQTMSFVDAISKGKYTNAINHAVSYAPESVRPELGSFVNKVEGWMGVPALEGADPGDSSGETGKPAATPAATGDSSDSKAAAVVAGAAEETQPAVTHVAGEVPGEDVSKPVAPDATADVTETYSQLETLVRSEVSRQLAEEHVVGTAQADTSKVNWFGIVGTSFSRVWGIILGLVEIGLLTFLIPFYFFMFSVAWPKMLNFGKSMIMENHRDRTIFLLGEMDSAVSGFVRGRIVICSILALLYAIGWTIVGVPYAIPLGIIVGIFTLVPYLGGIGLPLSVGLLFADQFSTHDTDPMVWWAIILWPSLIFLVCQFLDDYVLTPLIAGKATNLDPVTIVVAILAGGALAGLYGMLIAIPVAACIKILLREVLMPRIRDWIAGKVDDPLPIDE